MILLDPRNYPKLKEPLTKVEINYLFAQTVIEQKMDGEIYVDDLEQPSSFYVKHSYGMALLFGKTDNERFNQSLVKYLLNEEGKRVAGEWLQVFPEDWNDRLNELLGHKIQEFSKNMPKTNPENNTNVIRSVRVNFQFNREKYTPVKPNTASNLRLVQTDANLFYQVKGTVVPNKFWRNGNEFANIGTGFTLMHEQEPVSTAFTSFVHEPKLELGIETIKKFQGKGLARNTCSALIDYCLENNFEPVWACRLENTGSFRLAQKLGFEPVRNLPYYQLPFQNSQKTDQKVNSSWSSLVGLYYFYKI